jgi:hypothetical protein
VNALVIGNGATRDGEASFANAGIVLSALLVDQPLYGVTNERIRAVLLATGNLRLHQLFQFRSESDGHIQLCRTAVLTIECATQVYHVDGCKPRLRKRTSPYG